VVGCETGTVENSSAEEEDEVDGAGEEVEKEVRARAESGGRARRA